eukprot:jgi/Picsp_1/4258/NSC_01767-R1_protein
MNVVQAQKVAVPVVSQPQWLGSERVCALRVRQRSVIARAQSVDAGKKSEVETGSGKEKIYVGKGRFIEDDPNLYPEKTPLTGGFAGGEVGLQSFVAKADISPKSSGKKEKGTASGPKKGIYVGKGKFVSDDSSSSETKVMKLTGRDSSLVGGFAGGEMGLQEYVSKGEIPFADGASGRRQQSPLIVAGIVSIAAVTGGILLTDVSDLGEQLISGTTKVTPAALAEMDENTKLLLEAGVLMIGVVASVIGGKALLGSLRSSIKEGATRFGVLAAFWMVVFIAARFVLDSP